MRFGRRWLRESPDFLLLAVVGGLTLTPAQDRHFRGTIHASSPVHHRRRCNSPCIRRRRPSCRRAELPVAFRGRGHVRPLRPAGGLHAAFGLPPLDYEDGAAQSVAASIRLRLADMRNLFLVLAAIAIVSVVGLSVAGVFAPKPRHWTPGQVITLCGAEASRPIPSDCPRVLIGKDDIPDSPHDHIP